MLLCSTAAPRPVVTLDRVRPALADRGDRPLCILDIAMPRDVDPAVGQLDNVFLYNLDDLQAVVSANLERRRDEVPTAEELIAARSSGIWEWFAGLAAVPVLTQMRGEMERCASARSRSALRQLDHLAPADRAVVEELSRVTDEQVLTRADGAIARRGGERPRAGHRRRRRAISSVSTTDRRPTRESDRDHHHDPAKERRVPSALVTGGRRIHRLARRGDISLARLGVDVLDNLSSGARRESRPACALSRARHSLGRSGATGVGRHRST